MNDVPVISTVLKSVEKSLIMYHMWVEFFIRPLCLKLKASIQCFSEGDPRRLLDHQLISREGSFGQTVSSFSAEETGLLNCMSDLWVSFEEAKVTHTPLGASVWQPMVDEMEFVVRSQNLIRESIMQDHDWCRVGPPEIYCYGLNSICST